MRSISPVLLFTPSLSLSLSLSVSLFFVTQTFSFLQEHDVIEKECLSPQFYPTRGGGLLFLLVLQSNTVAGREILSIRCIGGWARESRRIELKATVGWLGEVGHWSSRPACGLSAL